MQTKIIVRSALLAMLVVIAPAAVGAQQVLSPGDIVQIAVWRNPELSADSVPVGLDGTLKHPLYQGIQVAGIPMSTVRTRLAEFLARFTQNPQFTVEPLFRVAVGGEVRQPNLFALRPETTLLQALAMAGGVTERARLERVTFIRGGESRIVDFTNPSDPIRNTPVQSGDQLVVPARRSTFREVIAPGAGVLAAIASIANLFLR